MGEKEPFDGGMNLIIKQVWIFRLFIAASLLIGAASVRAEKKLDSCSLNNLEEWQNFLKKVAAPDNWVQTCEDSTCDKKFFQTVQEQVQKPLDQCHVAIDRQPVVKACTAHLRQFLPAWIRQHDAVSYGFDVSNHEYLRAQEGLDQPSGMMKIPQSLLEALPDQSKVQEVARLNGWRYLTHNSAINGIRTFIYIPDPEGRFDQWLILNLQSLQQRTIGLQMPVSLLAVQKKTGNNEPLQNVRLNFRDYALSEEAGKIQISVNEEGNGKCFSCHVSGLRQLIPRNTAVLEAKPVKGEDGFNQLAPPDFAFRRLVELNKIMRRYGNIDWNNQIHPEDHGPMLGQVQGCTSCHNGVTRGALSIFTSETQIRQKVFTELSMPPNPFVIRNLERSEMKNPPLSTREEQQLAWSYHQNRKIADELIRSRAEILRQWILDTPCSEGKNKNQSMNESAQAQAVGARSRLNQKQKENL